MATELVGIELQLRGEEEVFQTMQKLDKMMKTAEGKHIIEVETENAKRRILELTGAMNALYAVMQKSDKKSSAYEEASESMKDLKVQSKDARLGLNMLQKAQSTASKEAKELAKAEKEVAKGAEQIAKQAPKVKTFGEIFKGISTVAKHTGQNLQTLGNTLTRLGSPFRSIMQGAVFGVGYKALGQVTAGLEGAFDRVDTMRKYRTIMASFNKGGYTAEQSIQDLDKSVLGLPIALDEAVTLAQRFTTSMGDMEKGTKLAIATNNAFLASMSTDTQRYQGMMQLQDVIGGKKMNAKEWQALANSMLPAIRMMAEYKGLESEAVDEYVAMVQQGKISNKQFLEDLLGAGTDVNGKIRKMAEASMDTWQAFFSRIKTASARLGEAVITSFDEIVKIATGGKFETLNKFLDDLIIGEGIDKMTKSVKGWIKAHPEEIINFFKQFKNIDIKGAVKAFAESTLIVAEAVGKLANAFGGKGLEIYARVLPFLGIVGRGLTTFGGLLKGLSQPIGFIGAVLIKGLSKLAKGGGLFGKIASSFGSKKAIDTVAKNAPVASKASASLVSLFKNVALLGGTVSIIGGTGFIAFKSFKSMMADLEEIIATVDRIDWEKGTKVLLNMGGFFVTFGEIGTLLGNSGGVQMLLGSAIAGLITIFASGSFAMDMWLIKKGVENLEQVLDGIDSIVTKMGNIKSINSVGAVKTKIENTIRSFNEIIEMFRGKVNVDTKTVEGGLKQFSGKFVDSIENLNEALKLFSEATVIADSFNGVDTGKFEGASEKIGTILTELGSIYDNIPEEFLAQGGADQVSNLSSAMSNFNKTFTSLGNLLSKVKGLNQQFTELSKDRSVKQLKTDLRGLFIDLGGIYKGFVGGDIGDVKKMADKMHNFSVAFGSIRNIFTKMKEIEGLKLKSSKGGYFSAMQSISNLVSQLKKILGSDNIGTLNSQIQNFVDQVEMLVSSIEQLNNEYEIDLSVKLASNEVKGADDVVKKINKAVAKIDKSASKLGSPITISVPVNITANVSVKKAVSAITRGIGVVKGIVASAVSGTINRTVVQKPANAHVMQNGGAIYRADGGSVFKPRGTDKIPAMLSAGEFVQKKKAVDTFGLDFMRRVNDLDVRGAMNALLARGSSMASIGRQSIVNNTVNNNQRSTFNINTNNSQFVKMRAGRFAGAL